MSMDAQAHAPNIGTDTGQVKWDGPNRDIPVVDSSALLRGRPELLIRHGTETYRLRLTASGKLLLTK